MSNLREVTIVVSSKKTNDTYYAKSYPDDDYDNNGKFERYGTPVYKVFIKGTDTDGKPITREWPALRFMPYWNDPKHPDGRYKTLGWVNSGKHSVYRKPVARYKADYEVHNRHSDWDGAIEIDGTFLLHAGPPKLDEEGWGAAGCVEIIGNFDHFKKDIKSLSGSSAGNTTDAILELVKHKKLLIEVEYAVPPDLKAHFYEVDER